MGAKSAGIGLTEAPAQRGGNLLVQHTKAPKWRRLLENGRLAKPDAVAIAAE